MINKKRLYKTKNAVFFVVAITLIFFSLLQPAMALETTITIDSIKDYNLSIILTVNDAIQKETLKAMEVYSNFQETVSFTFPCDISKVDYYTMARLGGSIIKSKKYYNQTCGVNTKLDLLSSPAPASTSSPTLNSPITGNVVSNVSNNVTNVPNGSIANRKDNLNVVSNNSSKSSLLSKVNFNWKSIAKYVGYILAILVAIVLIGFIIKKSMGFIKSSNFNNKTGNLFRKRDDGEIVIDKNTSRELIEAEKKIKEAQNTIDNIMNRKKRLVDAERKFNEAKRELDRLKGY